MIYICIPESQIATANQWVRDNLDKQAQNTFVANRKDGGSAKYALASIVDNGTAYSEGMKTHFDYAEDLPGLYKSSKGADVRSQVVAAQKAGGKLVGKELALEGKASGIKSLVLSLGEL